MSLKTNLALIEAYVEQQGFTWQQVRDDTWQQWKAHCIAAGIDPDELVGMKRTLKSIIIKKKKRVIFVNQVKDFLVHIRNVGPDDKTTILMQELFDNPEDYYGD